MNWYSKLIWNRSARTFSLVDMRSYYLVHLPTLQKKIRVLADWILDMFFKRDVTMLKTLIEEEEKARRE